MRKDYEECQQEQMLISTWRCDASILDKDIVFNILAYVSLRDLVTISCLDKYSRILAITEILKRVKNSYRDSFEKEYGVKSCWLQAQNLKDYSNCQKKEGSFILHTIVNYEKYEEQINDVQFEKNLSKNGIINKIKARFFIKQSYLSKQSIKKIVLSYLKSIIILDLADKFEKFLISIEKSKHKIIYNSLCCTKTKTPWFVFLEFCGFNALVALVIKYDSIKVFRVLLRKQSIIETQSSHIANIIIKKGFFDFYNIVTFGQLCVNVLCRLTEQNRSRIAVFTETILLSIKDRCWWTWGGIDFFCIKYIEKLEPEQLKLFLMNDFLKEACKMDKKLFEAIFFGCYSFYFKHIYEYKDCRVFKGFIETMAFVLTTLYQVNESDFINFYKGFKTDDFDMLMKPLILLDKNNELFSICQSLVFKIWRETGSLTKRLSHSPFEQPWVNQSQRNRNRIRHKLNATRPRRYSYPG